MPVNDAVRAVDNIYTDAVLWYNVGVYGQLGYGVPNPSNDIAALNPQIIDLTNLVGRALFLIMHHEDVDMTVPPSINTLVRVHQLVKRAAQVLEGRSVPPNEPNMEVQHVTPAGDVFRVYPVPFFKVRNPFLKRWAHYVLMCLGEMMQHTENRKTLEISTQFGAMVGSYMRRIYQNMAVECFGKTRAEVMAATFWLTEADFAAYDPTAFFTPFEMIDTVPALDNVFTEDRKADLGRGIPVTELPVLQPYPVNITAAYDRMRDEREGQVDPDTGQQRTDGSRIGPEPSFPDGGSFI